MPPRRYQSRLVLPAHDVALGASAPLDFEAGASGLLLDPITFTLMRKPLLVTDTGITYDEQTLLRGGSVYHDPASTGQRVVVAVPNRSVMQAVDDHLHDIYARYIATHRQSLPTLIQLASHLLEANVDVSAVLNAKRSLVAAAMELLEASGLPALSGSQRRTLAKFLFAEASWAQRRVLLHTAALQPLLPEGRAYDVGFTCFKLFGQGLVDALQDSGVAEAAFLDVAVLQSVRGVNLLDVLAHDPLPHGHGWRDALRLLLRFHDAGLLPSANSPALQGLQLAVPHPPTDEFQRDELLMFQRLLFVPALQSLVPLADEDLLLLMYPLGQRDDTLRQGPARDFAPGLCGHAQAWSLLRLCNAPFNINLLDVLAAQDAPSTAVAWFSELYAYGWLHHDLGAAVYRTLEVGFGHNVDTSAVRRARDADMAMVLLELASQKAAHAELKEQVLALQRLVPVKKK